MGLIKKYMNQTRKPEGILGKMMLKGMNMGHAKLSDFGISKLPNNDYKQVLEIGCGAGRNIDALLKKYKNAFVTGVDYSPLSVEKAIEFNKNNSNRCKVIQGDVSNLNLEANTYDLATAFETVYFWPNLDKCFKNVFNVLKEDGTFMIVNELEGTCELSLKYEQIIEGLKVYKIEELYELLKVAGFKKIDVFKHNSKAWFSIIAIK